MKIKLYTHTDLDGIGCYIVAKILMGEVDVEFCDYSNINERVIATDFEDYDKILISDISVSAVVADAIDYHADKIQLLDHHKTAKWLMDEYSWAIVDDSGGNSGTSMMYNYLVAEYPKSKHRLLIDTYVALVEFVNAVRSYDTWEWHAKGKKLPKQLNDLFGVLGRDRFIKTMLKRLKNDDALINEVDLLMIHLKEERTLDYIAEKSKQMRVVTLHNHKFGVVFAEANVSALGNALSQQHPELDFVAVIDMKGKINFRTVRDDVDVAEFAKLLGGGGHSKASGCEFEPSLEILKLILDK